MITKKKLALRDLRDNKAQLWVSDYTISMLLFILAVILSVNIIINSFPTSNVFEELKTDASKISEILLSEGYPSDWDNESVIRPGLLTANRLNKTKVINAMNMSYSSLKPKLQALHDFIVIFEDPAGDMIEFEGLCVIGSPDVSISSTGSGPLIDCHNPDFTTIDYDNMIRIIRLVIYESRIIRMVVYVWE
ncbi:MAG TPA: hypothetical protein ENL16_02065 [Candidatus Woesearchaeota archaeon]|nr:hypothetical protein [Candidatus Woesearchaeota archaeon]